jgi:hypothetical protein
LLPEGGRKFGCQQATKLVGTATRRKGYNDLHLPAGPGVRAGVDRGPQPERSRERRKAAHPGHPMSSRSLRPQRLGALAALLSQRIVEPVVERKLAQWGEFLA